MNGSLLIGLVAGVVSALLFASAATGTLLGVLVLLLLSPLPVAIAGLGWGWPAAAVAALSGAGVVAGATTGRGAIFHLMALGLPAAGLSYFALLSRTATDGETGVQSVEWYPLGRLLAFAAGWAGVLAALSLLSAASDLDGLRTLLRETIERAFLRPAAQRPAGAPQLTADQIKAMTELMVLSFAGITATCWFLIGVLNLWLGGLVAAKSGRLVRPWPALSTLALPRSAPVAFAAAIAATFLPGYGGLIGSGFASALFAAYLLVGLAIIHHVTRGNPARPMILAATYAALMLLGPFGSILVSMIGIAEPISPLRRRPTPAPGSPFT
jgi:hypothetical protein